MCDIFISYSRKDVVTANKLASMMNNLGLEIWFDHHLIAGERHGAAIEQQIRKAKQVLVLWSENSIHSDWVCDEASLAKALRKMIPVSLDGAKPPLGFRTLHTPDLSNFVDDHEHQVIKNLLQRAPQLARQVQSNSSQTSIITVPFSRLEDRPPSPRETFRDQLSELQKGPKMVVIPAGEFIIGSGLDEVGRQKEESPQLAISLGEHFAMGIYPITFSEYDFYCRNAGIKPPDDQCWGRRNRPVINVNWHEAVDYCHWLSEISGRIYRLPTEAEWEYAARAQSSTRYWWGNEIAAGYAHCDGCEPENELEQTVPVGRFQPNPFGLFDMHGNVFEWCQDRWHSNYTGLPQNGAPWMSGVSSKRVIRGGSWLDHPQHLRSANRWGNLAKERHDFLGFRVVRELS